MIHFYYLFSLFFLSKPIHSSVRFLMNPGCNITNCTTPGNPAIFYGNQFLDDNTIHILYSSLDELTISIIQTKKGHDPQINYTALFQGNYSNAIKFDIPPINSFSLIIRRLIKFNDTNDTGHMDINDTSIQSYWLKNLTTNITRYDNNTFQPLFFLPLNDINGLLTIDIIYPGDLTRDTQYPKLRSTPRSYFLNIALQANDISYGPTRFAFEFYIIQLGPDGTQLSSTKYIDDQYTPGIFTVWQLKTRYPSYPASMLWKPIVYKTVERSSQRNTLMEIYDLKNNLTLDVLRDQGIFRALYKQSYLSGFNISLGRSQDKFFIDSNYSFIQFTAGLDILEMDPIKQFVTLALIFSLALPVFVSLIAILFIIKRRCTRQNTSSYDPIDD